MPVGFKNTTEGSLTPAADAVQAARNKHWFPSVTKQGVGAIFQTLGNEDCHVILRGGSRTGPNFDDEHVRKAATLMENRGLPSRVMVDCSHGNSQKDYKKQRNVLEDVATQIQAGSPSIMGVMIESNLVEGRQDIGAHMTFGQSVTDACISLTETRELLLRLAESCEMQELRPEA
jgi:3-deoxy-7-phosphoheptulonate synthase